MTNKVWKTVFFASLSLFLLLSTMLLGMVLVPMLCPSPGTGIIGGAGWPTFRFLLSQALRSPIGYAHSSAFLLSIVAFIGWCKCKK